MGPLRIILFSILIVSSNCGFTDYLYQVVPVGLANYFATSPTPKKQCQSNRDYERELVDRFDNYLVGQHIAYGHIFAALKSHFENEPSHALSLVLSGTTGVGKNLVSGMIGQALFGMERKDFVHTYSGRLDFPSSQRIEQYRQRLQEEVAKAVEECPYSVFIFDEIDKMPYGVIDVIKPYVDFHEYYRKVSYRHAIFIFITNIGGKEINSLYARLKNSGVVREDMKYSHYEKILRHALFENEGMLGGTALIEDHLIGYYIPFLPLEKKHVVKCILLEMRRQRMDLGDKELRDRVVKNIIDKLDFLLDEYSTAGCKRVSDHVAVERHRRPVQKENYHTEF